MFRLVSVSKAPCLLTYLLFFLVWRFASTIYRARMLHLPERQSFAKLLGHFFLYSYPLFANLRARGDTPSERQCPPPPKGNVASMCICQHTKALLCRRHFCSALRFCSLLTVVSINLSNIALAGEGRGGGLAFS